MAPPDETSPDQELLVHALATRAAGHVMDIARVTDAAALDNAASKNNGSMIVRARALIARAATA